MQAGWKYFPGDLVQHESGETYGISTRRQIVEEGEEVPIYEAVPVRDGKVQGSVCLLKEATIVGAIGEDDP
jgi:hypothetical protein